MLSKLLESTLLAALLLGSPSRAEDQPKDPARQLAEIDAQIKEQPDDPMLHYARAQLLAKTGKYDDAYAAAQTAMEKFIAAKKELAWLMLDSFEAGGHKVTVHFNMGPDERRLPETGIVRPLSFRIYAKDGASILDTIDFEIGYFNGKRLTAAFGQTTEAGHANLGPAKPDLPYSKIRAAAIELIAGRVKEN
jgi:hypothetical protein